MVNLRTRSVLLFSTFLASYFIWSLLLWHSGWDTHSVFQTVTTEGHRGFQKSLNGSICKSFGSRVVVMVVVETAASNFEERQQVRNSWGKKELTQPMGMLVVYLLGRTRLSYVQTAIDLEAQQFGDVLQADFYDDYSKLSEKSKVTRVTDRPNNRSIGQLVNESCN